MAQRSVPARPAAVAGSFYPEDADELEAVVAGHLDDAALRTARPDPPKALIAPHAGYVFSGPVAASAYATITPLRGVVSRVVLLGPSHRTWFEGLALPATTAFATPCRRRVGW